MQQGLNMIPESEKSVHDESTFFEKMSFGMKGFSNYLILSFYFGLIALAIISFLVDGASDRNKYHLILFTLFAYVITQLAGIVAVLRYNRRALISYAVGLTTVTLGIILILGIYTYDVYIASLSGRSGLHEFEIFATAAIVSACFLLHNCVGFALMVKNWEACESSSQYTSFDAADYGCFKRVFLGTIAFKIYLLMGSFYEFTGLLEMVFEKKFYYNNIFWIPIGISIIYIGSLFCGFMAVFGKNRKLFIPYFISVAFCICRYMHETFVLISTAPRSIVSLNPLLFPLIFLIYNCLCMAAGVHLWIHFGKNSDDVEHSEDSEDSEDSDDEEEEDGPPNYSTLLHNKCCSHCRLVDNRLLERTV